MSLVGAVHTTRLVIDPVHRAVTESAANLQLSHVLDEGILRRLVELGNITPGVVDWLTEMVASTERTGAELAVVSCSSLSPCVNQVRDRVRIPVLKIDEPMMEYGVQNSDRIGLVMTNPTTEEPSRLLFQEVAERFSSKTDLIPYLCEGAFAKLVSGDQAGHDAAVVKAIEQLLERADLVFLAQISIASVRKTLKPEAASRVFSSLDFIGPAINRVITGG